MSKENQEQSLIQRGRYALTNPDTGKPARYTRVTKFADALEDKENLIGWIARHVAKGMSESDDLLIQASRLDVNNDRGPLDRIWNEAKKLAGGDRAADDGTTIHALTEAIDRGEDPRIPVKWKGHLQRYQELVSSGPLQVVPEYIERVTCVPELGVAGTFDRLMRVKRDTTVTFPTGKTVELKKGELVVADVKTSKTLQYSQLKFATQFACYSRARHAWVPDKKTWESLPEINQYAAFILWLPSTKTDAEIVAVDIEAGWEAALECKRVREMRNSKKLIQSVFSATPESDPDSYAARIKKASTRGELSSIWSEANENRMWTPELRMLGENRLKELGS